MTTTTASSMVDSAVALGEKAASELVEEVLHGPEPLLGKGRKGLVFDRWPFRLDIEQEYQDWIVSGMSLLILFWCTLPCLCGRLRNPLAKRFTTCVYKRIHIYFLCSSYCCLFMVLFTIGVLPGWTVNQYLDVVRRIVIWSLRHLHDMIKCFLYLLALFLLFKFRDRLLLAAGVEHMTIIKLNWRDLFGIMNRRRPVEVYIWKVEDLMSAPKLSANNIFVECHLGNNEPVRTRVHSAAGQACSIRESFQLNLDETNKTAIMTLLVMDQSLVSSELGRLTLTTKEICAIEEQTGKRRIEFTFGEDAFVAMSLTPRGQVWIAISPVDDNDDRA